MDAPPEAWAALSLHERTRAEGMGSDRARAAFVVGRALLRRGLADALGMPPTGCPWPRRKLARSWPATARRSASATRTDSWSWPSRPTAPPRPRSESTSRQPTAGPFPPARTWLTDAEHDGLPCPADDAICRAWVRRWTAKEAIAKALGTGLGTPLTAITVAGERATVTGHEPIVWTLHHLDDWPHHAVTVAIPAATTAGFRAH